MKIKEVIFSNDTMHLERRCRGCGAKNGYEPQVTDETWIMPFGKHVGKKLKDIPEDYVGWCIENLKIGLARKFYAEAKRRGMSLVGWESFESKESEMLNEVRSADS